MVLALLARLWPAAKSTQHVSFPVWRRIRLGTYKSAAECREAMSEAGIKITPWADYILEKSLFPGIETEVDLVLASGAELGFKEEAKYSELCVRAKQRGLELCPAEVGPALRFAQTCQPQGESFFVAMEVVTDSFNEPRVFNIVNQGGSPRLFGNSVGKPEYLWHPDLRLVFVRPRA